MNEIFSCLKPDLNYERETRYEKKLPLASANGNIKKQAADEAA